MPRPKSDLDQIKTATAAVVACIVQTLDESDQTFRERFEGRLSQWYEAVRNNPEYGLPAIETISWARDAARSGPSSLAPSDIALGKKK